MFIFRYALLERPPMPGAMPREGLMECDDIEGVAPSGHHAWGWADYCRKLSDDEVNQYEMEYVSCCDLTD